MIWLSSLFCYNPWCKHRAGAQDQDQSPSVHCLQNSYIQVVVLFFFLYNHLKKQTVTMSHPESPGSLCLKVAHMGYIKKKTMPGILNSKTSDLLICMK